MTPKQSDSLKTLIPSAGTATTFMAVGAMIALATIVYAGAQLNRTRAAVVATRQELRALEDRKAETLRVLDQASKALAVQQHALAEIGRDPHLSPDTAQQAHNAIETGEEASAAVDTLVRFGPLVNYRIVVYFEASVATDAAKFRDNLTRLGFPGKVDLRERLPEFLDDATRFGYHIRYDDIYESDAADYLIKLLPDILPGHVFGRVKVVGARTKSDSVLTVFLFNKR